MFHDENQKQEPNRKIEGHTCESAYPTLPWIMCASDMPLVNSTVNAIENV